MKRVIFLLLIIICAMSLTACEKVDYSGFIDSIDVDSRFEACDLLPEKQDVKDLPADFSLLVISDTHVYHGSHSKLAALKERIQEDRFILVCGDITQCGYEEDYKAFCSYLDDCGIPYYATIGNHDLYFNGWENYRKTLGRPCYTFKAGPIRIIALDSANGTLGGKQRSWLESILKNKNEPLCFVFTHFELFNPGFTDIEEVLYLMTLFEEYDVNYVFMGHTHEYYHKTVNDVNYINVPGFEDGSKNSFIRVTINGTKVSFVKVKN